MEFKTKGIDELLTDLLCTIKLLKVISAVLLIAFLTTLLVHINTKDKIIEIPVEVEKEVIKEIPIEVVKEVPVEVVKEVEVIKHEPNCYDLIEISPEEYELLAQIVSLEATNQGDIGQRAVVEVCLNRVLNDWGDSLWEVLNAKGQFATLQFVGSSTAWAKASEQEYNNIDYVLEHGATILPTDYVYFDTKGVNGHDHIRINGHYFGRE